MKYTASAEWNKESSNLRENAEAEVTQKNNYADEDQAIMPVFAKALSAVVVSVVVLKLLERRHRSCTNGCPRCCGSFVLPMMLWLREQVAF